MKTVSHFLARLTFAVLISALPVFAANHVVHMTSLYEFAPDYLEIQVGDTVTWHNDDDTESLGARSDTGFIWDTGGVETNGDSEPVPFTTVGTFPYYDPTYFPLGMTGTIVVSSGSTPPAPALIVEPRAVSGGAFAFTITNLTLGKTTIIETSTNLVNWTSVATNVPTSTTLNFTNAAGVSPGFFRSSQLP